MTIRNNIIIIKKGVDLIMVSFNNVMKMKKQTEELGLCDKNCFVIANKKQNNVWKKFIYGAIWVKGDKVYFSSIKNAHSLFKKGVVDYNGAVEINLLAIENISDVQTKKADVNNFSYFIDVKYKNNENERYCFVDYFINEAKYVLSKIKDLIS